MSLLSGAGMTVCMLGLAAYLHLVPNGSKTALGNPHLATIPFVLLLVYVVRDARSHTRARAHARKSDPRFVIPFRVNRLRGR